jgi:adducin
LTIDQALNFNPVGYGYLEFEAWKRRYNIGSDFINDLSCNKTVLDTENNNDTKIMSSVSPYERELRTNLSNLFGMMDELGWTDTIYQHITAKIRDTDEILINPYGVEFGDVTPENIMEVTTNGSVIHCGDEGGTGSHRRCCRNPSGIALHTIIHSARADAHVVLHAHHPAISAVSVSKFGLVLFSEHYSELLTPITYHDFDSLSLAVNATNLLRNFGQESKVLILRNHGIIVIGDTCDEAFNRMYASVRAAQIQIKMMAMFSQQDFDWLVSKTR